MSAENVNAGQPQHFINDPADESTPWVLPSPRRVGIICLILTETALFSIFVVAYLFYIGRSLNGPFPADVLHLPVFASVCLIGSSFTIMAAEFALKKANHALFNLWWGITMLLGIIFIVYTGLEWHELIYEKNLTIRTNVFGSTFYSLVGLHASHVIVGLFLLGSVLVSSFRGKLHHDHHEHVEVISWYWHFVDAVWIVVLGVVYILSVHMDAPLMP
jgi:Heme/copper-type cytochrome/quinol oxidase, subunit 3